MSQVDKLVVYYSCFDYELDSEDFSHIEVFRQSVIQLLDPSWSFHFQRELEFLNIRYSKLSLELCCEVYMNMLQQGVPNTYESFRGIFITELLLQTIWTSNNPEILVLNEILQHFYSAACRVQQPFQVVNSFKLLTSHRKKPELQALVVAQEAVTTLSQKICRVLKKASLPLENFIGPELTGKISVYLNALSSRVMKTQQVTSSFVTNIVEIDPKCDNMKVRVIKPAKEFYDKVLETWSLLGDSLDSTGFLLDLRSRLGTDWNERLVAPALCFYEIAKEEWVKSKSIGYNFFLKKMQARLIDMWKQNIIETSKTFQEHMITKTVM